MLGLNTFCYKIVVVIQSSDVALKHSDLVIVKCDVANR